jgi:pSer/pThr/pTyr-binding forkhead associated (FHA) protein
VTRSFDLEILTGDCSKGSPPSHGGASIATLLQPNGSSGTGFMSSKIHVEIIDRSTGKRAVQLVSLPVEIGKQPTSQSCIRLDPTQVTISRVHGRIAASDDGGFVYTDSSSNGTTVDGTFVKGAERKFAVGDAIRIETFDLRIVELHSALIKHTDRNLKQIAEIRVAPGDAVLISRNDTGLTFAPEGEGDGGDSAVGRLLFDGNFATLETDDKDLASQVLLNGHPPKHTPVEARVFDVMQFGGDRLELLRPDASKIVCGNPECHLLNDLPFEENCVWCGYYLAASGSFTRVTPP